MNHGKQLRLFLPDGTASGPRYYELVNWTGQALRIPVSRVKDLESDDWQEFRRPGVYLVRGQSEEGHPRLYIGESEDVGHRVQGHPANLGFEITELLLFSSKDDNLTKSHVLWLESELIRRAGKARRIALANTVKPNPKHLSKVEQATMGEFIEHLELVAQTAGFEYFSERTKRSGKAGEFPKLFLEMPKVGIKATADITDEGFVVHAGSDASGHVTPALSKGYASLHDDLIDSGVLVEQKGGKLRFAVDHAFASPSAAGSVVAGSPTAGPQKWKDKEGKKLADLLLLKALAPSDA